jgi:hypothetical protein
LLVLLPYECSAILCGIPYSKRCNLLILDDDLFYDKLVIALTVLDIALFGRYPSEWSCIEFPSDAPIEASSLEGV